MALKPYRKILDSLQNFYFNEVAEPGIIVVFSGNGGSGAFTDQSAGKVVVPNGAGGPSGTKPAGVLMIDSVDVDLTRQELNQHRLQDVVGSKQWILTKGVIVTDEVTGTPTAGQDAYYTTAGVFTTTSTNSTKVGRFLGQKDVDGYIMVDINIT